MEISGYKIQQEIGKGGMATVYLAIQESLERSVVLKILDKIQGATSEEMIARFVHEGRIVASLHHPNIVTIFDIGRSGEELYISMEYVQGGDLKQRLQSHISPKTALDIVGKIGSALKSAHTHNVIHRDVKPANILFNVDGTPLLTDFGIAKQMDLDKELTSTGVFLGSPNYVSPEQASGINVDGRSDIYSLGCIFYEMLTGSKPYHSDSVIEIVIQHKTSPVPILPESLSIYQPLLDRMMAKNIDERFASAEELIKSVEKLQSQNLIDENISPDFDVTGLSQKTIDKTTTKKKHIKLLIVLLLISATFFFSLQFVDIKLKSSNVRLDQISTNSVLSANSPMPGHAPIQVLQTAPSSVITGENTENKTKESNNLNSEEITRALSWLGKQCLDEFKLTYPPKDNAYYYFSRLLEIQPGNKSAYDGILSIAEQYVILAEQSFAFNEIKKTHSYIDIGLQIDPKNESLLSLQSLMIENKPGFWQTIKSFF
ncbi:MAG TPA: serine/threonine protein kinase [Thiotrichaceae bacterium]|jgi:serine/threonine protein kinase|nr:serine/threonine protein kinase [Thiotrichaceae bacterium]